MHETKTLTLQVNRVERPMKVLVTVITRLHQEGVDTFDIVLPSAAVPNGREVAGAFGAAGLSGTLSLVPYGADFAETEDLLPMLELSDVPYGAPSAASLAGLFTCPAPFFGFLGAWSFSQGAVDVADSLRNLEGAASS